MPTASLRRAPGALALACLVLTLVAGSSTPVLASVTGASMLSASTAVIASAPSPASAVSTSPAGTMTLTSADPGRTVASPTGTAASPTGTVASPTGTVASPTGTVASPTGTVASTKPTPAVPAPPPEGPLDNDAFQPTDLAAEETLARWRDELAAGRQAAALELLRSALVATTPGTGLRPDPADPTGRLVLGVEAAVRHELERLDAADLAAWLERFEDLAAGWAGLADDAALERSFPGTEAALRAALRLADRALEAGRPTAAATWCARAAGHLDLRARAGAAPVPGATEALARRRALAAALAEAAAAGPAATATLPPAWGAADDLGRLDALPFEFEGRPEGEEPFLGDLFERPSRVDAERGPGRGVRAGLVALGKDRVAIQTGNGVHLVDLADSPRRELVFDPARLVEAVLGRVGRAQAARRGGAPGWGHLPRVADDALLLVVGRAHTHRGPNALVRVDLDSLTPAEVDGLDPTGTSGGALDLAEPRWILSGARWWSEGRLRDHPLLADLVEAELQPGPLVLDDRVVVSLRTLDGELRHWLAALDLATGEPLWSLLVAKGSALDAEAGRFGGELFPSGAAPPLVACGPDGDRVFVGTHLGVGALVDAVDGRLLWSFKNRRRAADEEGWSGLAPLVTPRGLAWAPADSDHLYLLPDGPLAAEGPGASPLVAPPLALGEATDLVASDGTRHLTLARAGAERCLSLLDADAGTRVDSVYLRRGERFAGTPALGADRVVAATSRGLFLFDRADELRLVDHEPLPFGRGPRAAGGPVLALGDRLLVLGPGTLWVLERP